MPKGKRKQAGAPGAGNGRTSTGRVNKAECVRLVLGELGLDAKPIAIQDELRDRFGVVMSTKMISTYKGSVRRGKTGRSALMRSPAAPPPEAARAAPVVRGGDMVEEVRAVKELGDRLGAEKVRALLEVLYE